LCEFYAPNSIAWQCGFWSAKVAAAEPKVGRTLVSGRELFICDNMVDPAIVTRISDVLKTLNYQRKEKSRPDVPAFAASADIAAAALTADPFFLRLRAIAENMFPGEQLRDQRAYVNKSVFGDMYFSHRDCSAHRKHVTLLYYANLEWENDWGGETIFYNDDKDAEVVVSPRPGRVVVARGAILHRGTVPTRACSEERLTLAYKLLSGDPADDPPPLGA
jgi:Rps23 Pro-64 3,4-dihydroxylase Tpa1-like proline 4-hydroxylase